MTEDYTIERLEKTFMEHHERCVKENKERLEKFKIDYPDSEIPSHFLNDFSISEALHVICREINEINKSLDVLRDLIPN